jgi:hypothetical protein
MVSSKICFKCSNNLPLTEFYKHSAMGDGYLGKCKSCAKQDVLTHRLNNIDKIRAYDRERAKNPERARQAAEISKQWRKEDSRRTKCHSAVARAVRSGGLIKENCCVCGSVASLAHHESYDRPIDVVWYCQAHHKERHKEMAILGIEP